MRSVLTRAAGSLHAALPPYPTRQRPYPRHRRLVRCPVLSVFLVLHHREVRLVAALRNVVVFQRFQHRTPRFVGMRTIRKPAPLREMEDFTEITRQLLRLHVERSESLDARRINQPPR